MLHRTKYNRFRNESVTSVDELIHDLSMNPKVSAAPTSSAEPPFSPQAEVLSPTTTASEPEDGGTTLCTFINKVSNLKFTNSGSLLGIKGLPSAVKDLAVSKFQGGGGSSSGNSGHSVSAAASGGSFLSSSAFSGPQFHQEPGNMSSNGKKGRLEELQQGGEDWNPGGNGRGNGLVNKPSRGWLHSSEKISGPGVTYIVKYLGCIEVLRSMRSLDFNTRSQITREAISLVCEAVPGTKGALRKRKIIANHHMQSISFASGGDPDTTDFVAYVAKDPVNRRACHILECSDRLAQDVISTIGQAFDLRFQQYLQCPSSKLSPMHDRVLNMDDSPWTEEEEEPDEHPYYNNIPGKMPPTGGFIDTRLTNQIAGQDGNQMSPGAMVDHTYYQGRHCGENRGDERRSIFIQHGSCDMYSLPEGKSQVPEMGDGPTYINTQQIDSQVLAALQSKAEGMAGSTPSTAKDSSRKDLFDMKPFEDAILTQSQTPTLHKTTSVDNSSPLLVRSAAFRAQEELEGQVWYHGEMSRRQAEKLLCEDGDFLVRKSTTNPGSFVLTGMHNCLVKHLLLVDPEGTVRTKDHIFDSISHLIGHHRDNSLPIVSAGSELCLKEPVGRKQ
ncbi:SHC-transforming protein 3 isoform X2 [Hypomesus transpacificus]|uniref:SHC-transforming protein 3 isoform X2 n=1 Tax=Hypomesus transpacificus TaxID=137520 RepID=UPI001F076594|nr:SHC-transforming protein 3 isoform X2 [Hypomesus transpacificus]